MLYGGVQSGAAQVLGRAQRIQVSQAGGWMVAGQEAVQLAGQAPAGREGQVVSAGVHSWTGKRPLADLCQGALAALKAGQRARLLRQPQLSGAAASQYPPMCLEACCRAAQFKRSYGSISHTNTPLPILTRLDWAWGPGVCLGPAWVHAFCLRLLASEQRSRSQERTRSNRMDKRL